MRYSILNFYKKHTFCDLFWHRVIDNNWICLHNGLYFKIPKHVLEILFNFDFFCGKPLDFGFNWVFWSPVWNENCLVTPFEILMTFGYSFETNILPLFGSMYLHFLKILDVFLLTVFWRYKKIIIKRNDSRRVFFWKSWF